MRLLIFFNSNDDVVHRLQKELLPFSNLIDVKYFNSLETFAVALRESPLSETLVIYCIADRKCILLTNAIKKLLTRTKLIIIFQTNDPDLVSRVNDLHPRYYTFASGDLKDVQAVIARIINSFKIPESDRIGYKPQEQMRRVGSVADSLATKRSARL